MAEASLFVHALAHDDYQAQTRQRMSHINVGTGTDVSIKELAELVAGVTGFKGDVLMDAAKPDGTPRKLLDVSKLEKMGWQARIPLTKGIEETYLWFLSNKRDFRV